MTYWIKLVAVRCYAQSRKNIDFSPDVYWTAYFSLAGVIVAVAAGFLKSLLNVALVAANAVVFVEHTSTSFRKALFIAAFLFGLIASAVLLRSAKLEAFDLDSVHGFSLFDFVSRIIAPLCCFLVFVYGDSWGWLLLLLVAFGLMDIYARSESKGA